MGELTTITCGNRALVIVAKHTGTVYTILVLKNVTLSAEDRAIERAREVARSRRTTLNEAFRDWLDVYGNGGSPSKADEFRALMKRLRYADAGRKFTREEMNER